MISYEDEYFESARTPVTKYSTRDHTASLFCFTQRTTSMYVAYENAWKYLVRTSRVKNANKHKNNTIRRKPTNLLRILLETPYTTARILENE